MLNDCLRAALSYAARGWAVIPLHWPLARGGCSCGEPACPSPGKHPMLPRWEWHATNDSATLRSWWAQAPEANVGIACGVSGLVVLDIDGVEGLASLHKLQRDYEDLPKTLRFRTGSGGLHLVFADHTYSVPTRGHLLPKLDVRADGGQIVAPPSLHRSGRRYEVLPGPSEPALLPSWLARLIRKSPRFPAKVRARAQAVAPRLSIEPRQDGRRYRGLGDPGLLAAAIRRKLMGES